MQYFSMNNDAIPHIRQKMPNVQQFLKRLFNQLVDLDDRYMDLEETFSYRNIHDVEPPVYSTIRYNRLDELESILKEGIDVNCIHGGAETTPIHVACELGNLSALQLLVKYGGCINTRDRPGGATPLLVSSTAGNVEIVKFLLDNGADIDTAGDQSPPHVAEQDAQSGQPDYPEVFDAYQTNVALIQACREGHVDVVLELLNRGCDVNKQNKNGNTALHVACLGRTFYPYPTEQSQFIPSTFLHCPDPQIVSILLNHGARTDVTNYLSHTPLQRLFLIRHSFHLGMTGWSFSQRENNDIIRDFFAVVYRLLQHGANLPVHFSRHLQVCRDHLLSQELLTMVKFVENFGLMNDVFPVILDTLEFSLDNGCYFDPYEIKSLDCYEPQYKVLTDHIYPLISSARSLKSLCRHFLRCYLNSVHGTLQKNTVNKLPLPESLTHYLMGEEKTLHHFQRH